MSESGVISQRQGSKAVLQSHANFRVLLCRQSIELNEFMACIKTPSSSQSLASRPTSAPSTPPPSAATSSPTSADYLLANQPFNDSDWFPRRRALAFRRAAQRQFQLRLGAALHPSPHASPTQILRGIPGLVLANGKTNRIYRTRRAIL